jgi:hypothetical protein
MDRRVRDAIPTGQTTRTDLAVGPDAVWVLNRNRLPGQELLVRVDPTTDRVVARIPVGRNAIRVAVGEGSVWVLRSSPERADLVQVDPAPTWWSAPARCGRPATRTAAWPSSW